MLMKGGAFIQTDKSGFSEAVKAQLNIMRTQMALEDFFLEVALNSDQKTVIICDRGIMDGAAFNDHNVWQAVLDEAGLNTMQLRDKRYEAVIHLVTCADGAQQFYTLENNEARSQSLEESKVIDRKLIDAWVGHPHFSIINNKERTFQDKIDKCVETVCKYIGLPTPTSFHKKFLLKVKGNLEDIIPKDAKTEVFEMELSFLLTTGDKLTGDTFENCISKTGKNDSFTYNHNLRSWSNGELIDKRRQITAREYHEFKEQSTDHTKKTIKKLRQCFIFA